MAFELNEIFAKDSRFVKDLDLCQVRLMNNSDITWLTLVPMLQDIVEITDLTEEQYLKMNSEIRMIANALQNDFFPDKLNIAMIGNVVQQLHVHIIVRYKNDRLFPKPVWGHELKNYSEGEFKEMINRLESMIDREIVKVPLA